MVHNISRFWDNGLETMVAVEGVHETDPSPDGMYPIWDASYGSTENRTDPVTEADHKNVISDTEKGLSLFGGKEPCAEIDQPLAAGVVEGAVNLHQRSFTWAEWYDCNRIY